MKEKLISEDMIRGIHPIFRGRYGNILIKTLLSLSGADKVNAVYGASAHLNGLEFVNDMLDKLEITRQYENYEVLEQFKEGPFITVSNHPYGHIDGIIMASAVGSVRNDYKMMVNWILMQIDTMEDFFIGVNPFPKDNKMATVKSSVGGIKQCLAHLHEGHPLGLFPAGGVSLPNLHKKVEDRGWEEQESTMKLIKRAKVPVIPVYISGANSLLYQLLGYIGWQARTARLMHEVTNKRGKTIYVRFGQPVSVEEQNKFDNISDFGKFLKSKTYEMSGWKK
ncbi:MAG: lysophospholipid acyltransferase family protein [Dysgonomonas sp.]